LNLPSLPATWFWLASIIGSAEDSCCMHQAERPVLPVALVSIVVVQGGMAINPD
jgi:hypothetical protein